MVDFNKIIGIDDCFEAPNKIMETLFNKEAREKMFTALLKANNYNVDEDFFLKYFEEEYAERKSKKQLFTPPSISKLTALLVNSDKGNYFECCCGTGSMLIAHWATLRKKFSPLDYKPSYHFATVEELSDRTIPFLLTNMMIRGMNGVVIHGDSLTRKCKDIYYVFNENDDHLQFSNIIKLPHVEKVEKEFNIFFK